MIYGVRVKIQSRWQVVLSYYQQIQDTHKFICERKQIQDTHKFICERKQIQDTHKFICERKGTDFESVPGGV